MPWLRKWVSLRPKAACAAVVNALVTQVWHFMSVVGRFKRPKAACAAIVNVLVTQVLDFLSVVGRFTTKGCLRCDSECPGYASLGFLLCSGSVYDQRLPALR